MGTQCSHYPPGNPDTTNHCGDYKQKYHMSDFCSYAGVAGANYRYDWCEKLGSAGEWHADDPNGTHSCTYNDCHPYQELGSGCCQGCCGIAGKSVDCDRLLFNGNALTCCLQDKVCTALPNTNNDSHYAPPQCFSDSSKKYTCNPCQRDITSGPNTYGDGSSKTCSQASATPCKDIILDYCTGAGLADDDLSWMDRWYNSATGEETPQSCVYALKRNLYSGLGCQAADIPFPSTGSTCKPYNSSGNMSSSGAQWGQQVMDGVFERYRLNGFTIGTLPGQIGYNPFQEFLYSICCSVPTICQNGLNKTCSIYSAQRLSLNPEVANWCGCYLPQDEYDTYVNDYQINKECTPMCNRNTTIPVVTADNEPYLCTQDVCLIDDISINLVSTDISGQINISQMCGNCTATEGSTSSCSCIIQDNTIDAANAQIGGGINLEEACSSTLCTVANPDPDGTPPTLTVPCDQETDPNSAYQQALDQLNEENAKITRQENITYLVIIGVFLLVIFLAYFIIKPRMSSAGDQYIKRKIAEPELPLASASDVGGRSLSENFSGGTQIGAFSLGQNGRRDLSTGSSDIGILSLSSPAPFTGSASVLSAGAHRGTVIGGSSLSGFG